MDTDTLMDTDSVFQKAMAHAHRTHPGANTHKHAAFANSVLYLVTGFSGGAGGPPMREHAVTWALAGKGGTNLPVQTNLGLLTMQRPDGSLPRAGDWDFEAACRFAEPIVFGPLTPVMEHIAVMESCFNDDPEDLAALRE